MTHTQTPKKMNAKFRLVQNESQKTGLIMPMHLVIAITPRINQSA